MLRCNRSSDYSMFYFVKAHLALNNLQSARAFPSCIHGQEINCLFLYCYFLITVFLNVHSQVTYLICIWIYINIQYIYKLTIYIYIYPHTTVTVVDQGVLFRLLRVFIVYCFFFLINVPFSCWFKKDNLFLAVASSFSVIKIMY